MKYYIIAGEASGDLHAANLLKEIRKNDPGAEFRGFGGDLMEAEGAHLVKHYRDLAFMGFVEVLLHLRTILLNIDACKADIEKWKPDALILVDYPGFNLRIAPFAKKEGIPVFYYISPQIWAWKQSRVHKIAASTDKIFCILPFEKDFYKGFNYDVEFVGHPLLDALAQPANAFSLVPDQRKIIALLPGSRKQEIKTMLPVMLKAAKEFPQYRFVIGGAPSQTREFYREVIGHDDIEIVFGETYALLRNSYAAVVTSGTATLETALHGVPEVVCYRGSVISYHIAKQLVKVKYISLVNLVMDREIVKELIQDEMNSRSISEELKQLTEGNKRNVMLAQYEELKTKLGGGGASARVAGHIQSYLGK
ncbi:MAG TPA: lipid-A-disaccharide synthase [Bacteroidia bacterium]|nr:lipid-A-disaccharide synthase [Bacteroidia bacterium]